MLRGSSFLLVFFLFGLRSFKLSLEIHFLASFRGSGWWWWWCSYKTKDGISAMENWVGKTGENLINILHQTQRVQRGVRVERAIWSAVGAAVVVHFSVYTIFGSCSGEGR